MLTARPVKNLQGKDTRFTYVRDKGLLRSGSIRRSLPPSSVFSSFGATHTCIRGEGRPIAILHN